MMKVKLTDQNGRTYNNTPWGPNVTHGPLSGKGELCGPGWFHWYEGLGVAMLHNPIGANFKSPRVWRCKGKVEKRDGLKVGSRVLTTSEEIDVIEPTNEQRITCAILLAFDGPVSDAWATWAIDWLSGDDRTYASAYAASAAAYADHTAAAYAAHTAADSAAHTTAYYAAHTSVAASTPSHVDAVACAVFGY